MENTITEFLDNPNPTAEEILAAAEISEEMDNSSEEIEYCGESENTDSADFCSDGVRAYLNQIGQIPLLTAEEERKLAEEIREGGENAKEARDRFISANLRLVVSVAKKFNVRDGEMADLISMGNEGLMKAVDKFMPEYGNKFSTYAVWWIRQAITRGIADEGKLVRIPVHTKEMMNHVEKVRENLTQENRGIEPTTREIASACGLDVQTVQKLENYNILPVSFSAPIGEDGESTLDETIEDDEEKRTENIAEQHFLSDAIHTVLDKLPEREARVLMLRFGFVTGKEMTLDEIAAMPEFGVTRERIRQIENKALSTIKRNRRAIELLRDFRAA